MSVVKEVVSESSSASKLFTNRQLREVVRDVIDQHKEGISADEIALEIAQSGIDVISSKKGRGNLRWQVYGVCNSLAPRGNPEVDKQNDPEHRCYFYYPKETPSEPEVPSQREA